MSPIYGQKTVQNRILIEASEGKFGIELYVPQTNPIEWEAGTKFEATLRYYSLDGSPLPPSLPLLLLEFQAGEVMDITDMNCCCHSTQVLITRATFLAIFSKYPV